MANNVIIGIGFIILAIFLALLSRSKILGKSWLDKADKIASVVAVIIAIVAFVNPIGSNTPPINGGQQVHIIGDENIVGNSNTVTKTMVYTGDPTTSAEKRFESAQQLVTKELLKNFNNLALIISIIESNPPTEFWDIRRANETEEAYQDRATDAFRDYQKEIGLDISQLDYSTTVHDSFQRDLAYDPDVAEHIRSSYEQQKEVVDSFHRLEAGLEHLLSLINLHDLERTTQGISLHAEKITDAKLALTYAAAHFCLITEDEIDTKFLSDALSYGDIEVSLKPGTQGYQDAMYLATQFAQQKAQILSARIIDEKESSEREIERRITDPYLLELRRLNGLPPTLTEGEIFALKTKEFDDKEQDPIELFKLAAFAYHELDGQASTFYFQKAIDTHKLSPILEKFAKISIHRIQNPERYGKSIGVIILDLTQGGNFDKSGLRIGDILIAAEDTIINEPLDIASTLAKSDESPILVTVIRDGLKMIIEVKTKEAAEATLSQLIAFNAIQL